MGDRLLVLSNGSVEQCGTPIEIYQRPASVFVAQFIGSPAMNLLTGESDGKAVTLPNGQRLPIAASHQGKVSIGMRPEHLVAAADSPIQITAEGD